MRTSSTSDASGAATAGETASYIVTHKTEYHASERVSVSHNQAWLRPRPLPYQVCDRFELDLDPEASVVHEFDDGYGNPVHWFDYNQGYDALAVTARSHVTVHSRPSMELDASPGWEELRSALRTSRSDADLDAYEFCFPSPRVSYSDKLSEYARKSVTTGRPLAEAARDLTTRINADFKFDARATSVTTPVEECFKLRKGVCQDFAHVQIAMLRSLGLSARYVSGYIRTIPPEGKPRLVGADASHAWVSVYCGEELGWLDLDPTNDCIAGLDHVTVAWGRDYGDVTPLRGVFLGGGTHTLKISVDVMPLDEADSISATETDASSGG